MGGGRQPNIPNILKHVYHWFLSNLIVILLLFFLLFTILYRMFADIEDDLILVFPDGILVLDTILDSIVDMFSWISLDQDLINRLINLINDILNYDLPNTDEDPNP